MNLHVAKVELGSPLKIHWFLMITESLLLFSVAILATYYLFS